ncbi:MAG: DUF6259 domain-containing protein [Lentisphaeria bacterium]|nr:DUF6259 domain-containing protein [Lentisphaeria bacterium]
MRKWMFAAWMLFGCLGALGGGATLENSEVKFDFSATGALKSVLNKSTRRAVTQKDPPALWSVRLLNDSPVPLPDLQGAFPAKFQLSRDGRRQILTISWTGIEVAGGSLNVTATVELPDDSALASWRLRAETSGNPAPWIQNAAFPRLDALESLGDDYLIYGEDLGRLVRAPGQRMNFQELHNPGRWSMQFAAFFGSRLAPASRVPGRDFYVNGYLRGAFQDETGLFLAADDDGNHFKSLRIAGQRRGGVFSMAPVHYPAFPHWPMNAGPGLKRFTYAMPYAVKLGVFNGGVGTATALYRDLVRNRPWLSGSALIRDRMEEGTFWAKFYFGADKAVPEILKIRQFLQVPVNAHWARYGVYAFDHRNLHYLPSLAHFREGVDVLRRAGVGVAPYVCCAIWDQRADSYKEMADAAALDSDNVPYVWMLHGSPNSWMNPASPKWRRAYQDLTEKLFGQYGTNGQYLDVMACGGKLCYNGDLHRPNGGTYWADGNIRMLRDMRKELNRLNPDVFLCSEGFSENYIGLVDYFLMLDLTRYAWHGRQVNDAFPLFGYIYHDRAMTYGSDCSQQIPLDMLRWEMGLSFVWGVQLTYCSLTLQDPGTPHDLYTRELVHAWYQAGYPYLGSGVRIECAEVETPDALGGSALGVVSAPHRVTLKGDHLGFPWVGPAVLSGAWRGRNGNFALTLANISGSEQKISVVIDPVKLSVSGRTLWRSWPLPAAPLRKLEERETLRFTLPADRAMVLEIRDDAPAIRPLLPERWIPATADKNGAFPELAAESAELFGCDSAFTRHHRGKISLRDAAGAPLRCVPVNWPSREGRGGPRGDRYRSFHLLQPSGVTLEGDAAATVRLDSGIVSGTVDAAGRTILRGGDNDVMFAVPASGGSPLAALDGGIVLSPGKWRFCAFRSSRELPKPAELTLSALAGYSRRMAAAGEELLTGGDNLARERYELGRRTLALANAVTFAATGRWAEVVKDHDWLIRGLAANWRVRPPTGGRLTLLNENRRSELRIAPADGGFDLTALRHSTEVDVFRLLFVREFSVGGLRFSTAALHHAEVAEPLMLQIGGKDDSFTISSGTDQCTVPVKITNFAPVPLPLYFAAACADGWTLAETERLPRNIAPGTVLETKLAFRRQSSAEPSAKPVRVRVRLGYTPEPGDTVGADFTILFRQFHLKPHGKGVAQPEWSRRIRHGATLAAQVGESSVFKVGIAPGWSRPAKVAWKLADGDGKLLASGAADIPLGEVRNLSIPVPRPGTYTLRVDGNFFKLRPEGVSHYAYSATKEGPYYFFEEAMPLYFVPDPGADAFEFSCADGGPVEPGRVVVWGPDGTKRFEYSGNYNESRYFRIAVRPEDRGKVWCIRVEPEQDFSLRFGRGSGGWFTPEKEAMLVPPGGDAAK